MDQGTTNGHDVRMVVLKCPQCGGELRVQEGSDRARCAHCGTNVLIIDAEKGRTHIETPGTDATQDEEVKRFLLKFTLWGTAISFVLPLVITIVVCIIVCVVLIAVGIMIFFVGK